MTTPLHLMFKNKKQRLTRLHNCQSSSWLLLLALLMWGQSPLSAQCTYTFAEEYTTFEHYQFGDYCVATTSMSGNLSSFSAATFTRPDGVFMQDYYYERFDFTIGAVDTYTFSMPDNGGDFYFALYQGGFDPNNPMTNLITTNDDTNGLNPEIVMQLQIDNYTLVTTTSAPADTPGAYTYSISSLGGGDVLDCSNNPGGSITSPSESFQETIDLGASAATALTAASPMLINICFAGDLNGEYLEVRISNQFFYIGFLNYATPNIQYNAYCRDFIIPASAVTADLVDGDIDIDVRPYIPPSFFFPPDWQTGDNFAFSITNVSVDITVDGAAFTNPTPGVVTNGVESPYVICKSEGSFDFNISGEVAADMGFSIIPAVPAGALDAGTGVLTLANVNPGTYTVRYSEDIADCPVSPTRRIRVTQGPISRLKKAVVNCVSPTGDPAVNKIDLSRMFDNSNGIFNTAGGTFTVVAPDGAVTTISSDNDPMVSGVQYNYILTTAGCHDVTYAVSGGECGIIPITSTETLYFLPVPKTPAFLVMDMTPIPAGQGALTNNRIVVSNTTPRTVVVSNVTPGLSAFAAPQLTVVSNGGTVNGNMMPFPPIDPFTSTTSLTLQSPSPGNAFFYNICISEANEPIDTDGCLPNNTEDNLNTPGVDESTQPISLSTCAVRTCQTIVIVNPMNVNTGAPANAFFDNECVPDFGATDICDVLERPFLSLSCSFISLTSTFPFIEARLSNYPPVLFCDDPNFNIDWQGSLPGALGDATTGGQTIRDLAPPASQIVCDVITYDFCIPLVLAELCIDPIPLGPLENSCDKTIGQFVFDGLATILGRAASSGGNSSTTFNASGSTTMSSTTTTNADGSTSTTSSQEANIELSVGSTESDGNAVRPPGGSGIVIADTDGDGNFDFGVANYGFPALGSATIPNNVNSSGSITVRNVVAWPFNAADACGDISSESIDLLDILPIASIPIVGVIIEDALAAAGCNLDLVFTDGVTVEIPVYNNSVPEFANCISNADNTNSYIFSQGGGCNAAANWSIPVAYDGCDSGILPYRGYTPYLWGGTDLNGDGDITQAEGAQTPDAYYNSNTPIPVALLGNGSVMESGIYQTDGPLPGSDLPPGVYAIEYTAYSCSGIAAACRFNVQMTTGDPVLACPEDVTIKTDVDRCDAVATGLEPRRGISCSSIINYQITYPDGSTSTNIQTPWLVTNAGTQNDASGQTFPLGTSNVVYTMKVDINGDGVFDDTAPETQVCDFDVTVIDAQKPVAHCVDVSVKLSNTGSIEVFAAAASGSPFIDGGSTDNCAMPPNVLISKLSSMDPPSASVNFMCNEIGSNLVMLTASDGSNTSTCLAQVIVEDFFEDIQFDFDVPEICLEASNSSQLDFANYLVITLPNGTTQQHAQVASNAYLGDARGGFGITAFAPSPGYANVSGPDAAGSISPDGVYTPGTGSGFVTVSYVMAFPDAVDDPLIQNGLIGLTGCLEIVHTTFELRQPLEMDSPECECIAQNDRIVNLGVITGGLEPYTIQYGGVRLDVDNDEVYDDMDGEFIYEGTFTGSNGIVTNYDITDFTQDLGNLLVDYTQPTWSITVVDARGCELFRSGSCDNPDAGAGPEILCESLGPVNLTTEDFLCESQYVWAHALPTDNCDVILYTYTITNPDGTIEGPFDLTGLLNPDNTNPVSPQFRGVYEFEHGSPTNFTSTVTYYAEDATGNNVECSFEVNVIDDTPPRFINCPRPAVIVDAPATWCSAYANYSLPLAVDNCDIPVVTQVDDTGLTSGDIYPVGITINTFEAIDLTGNTTRCDVKIIVNDFHTAPTWECPDNVVTDTDPGDCGAIVENIAPFNIDDNCIPNLTVAYRIDDAAGNEIANGLDDASDIFFDLGTSTVSYSLQDMPMLLITEITHDLSDLVDGTIPVPDYIAMAGNPATGDYLEITNFNSATLDVSCLQIERVFATGKQIYAVPTFTILEPGGILTIHFGNGTDAPADHFFNVPDATDLPANEPTAYIVSLSRSILDVAVMNNYDISGFGPPAYNLDGRTMADYWSGVIGPVYGSGIVRTTVWDTNTSADFVPSEACTPTTIGTLNPMLPQPVPNGAHTAIQAQPTTRLECSFTVEVSDDEDPICGLYGDYINYPGAAAVIDYGKCVEIPLIVTDAFRIADLNLLLAGNGGDFGNLTFTLISPEGTAIELLDAICAGSNTFDFTLDGDPELADPILDNCANLASGDAFVPVGNIEAFNGEAVQGTWTLQIGHNGQVNTDPTDLTGWSLDISAREAYAQGNETLENDLDLCGAEFTWLHSILFDNCAGGSIAFTITFEDGTVEVSETLPIFPENTPFTHFFTVGVTQVNYVLTDAHGNTSSCGFEVTVLDTQFPEITCPPDLVIQLDPGECDTNEYPTTPIFEYDNCPEYVLSSFPPGTPVPIGDTIITLIITDASGNVTECTYNLTVLEHIPTGDIACVADQNVSLGPDCTATITADMVLSGNDYRCYDNYIVTLYPDLPDTGVDPISTSPMIGEEFVGQTIIAEICDPATGLCCWGYIHVDFYDEPEFICPPDAMVTCIESTHPDALGYPVVTSCVPGGATIEFDDEIVDNGTCGEPRLIITRTWTVTDGVGNFSQCVQNIVMAAFDLDQVIFPESYDGIDNAVLDCGDVLNDPSLTSIDSLGVPTIDGYSLYTAGYCTAAMNYEDEVFTICENSYIIFRQWRVINQCLPNPLASVREFTQTIRVEDIDGPGLTCPEDQTISVSPFNCEATYQVPPLVSVDACSAVTYMVEVDGDTLVYRPDNLYILTSLDLGDHSIRYLASDACGKLSNCSYTLTVEDQIAPTASCDEQLVVSLGGGDIANDLYGEARILASDIDEGSNDNCSAVTLAVRRNYWQDGTCDESADSWSLWGGYIDFYCCDINQEVTIELMATDIFGNENTCWMVITPEDKLNPYCYAPEDVTLTCNDLPLAFPGDIETAYDDEFEATSIMMSSIFGGASGTDNCAVDTIVERTPNIAINECGWGTITRRFEAWQLKPEGDANGNGAIDINEVYRSTNSCSQVITITEVHNFVIDFPEDAAADCGDPDVPTVVTTADGCDVLSINIGEPVVFAATGDECYKLSITYDIINWCLWDGEYTGYELARMTEDDGEALPVDRAVEGNERPVITYTSADGLCIDRDHTDRDGDSDLDDCASPQLSNYGRYIYTQFVKVYDSTVPVITVPEYGGPTDLCPTLEPGQFGDVTGNCETPVSIPFSIADDCELFDGAGNLVINMVSAELDAFAVDINGDGDIKSNEFLAEAGAAGNVMANITDNGDGTYSFDGSFPIITSAMGDNIYHAVRVLFEDGCGNQVSETLVFDVIDCKGPAPICINGLTVTLMPTSGDGCAMTIWASDFEGSPIYDCTGQGPEVNADGIPRVTKYAIYRAAEVEGNPDFVPHPTNTGLVLTDEDDPTTVVYVYAFDEDGNYDYCETYVLVQEHNSCNGPDGATIAGVITTTANETIEGVEVSINGAAQMSMTTGTDGAFAFEVPQLGGDYTVTPYHNDNPLNGVSTFDIVLISKHILNIDPLDTPYQRLAADVNNSETVTTLDMIQIRKLVLNITTSFTNNTSWRFIPAGYVFPNGLNPWQETFPELININNLSEVLVNADFVGVKTGDVNGNAQANALASDDRTLNGTFNLEVEDIELKAGNTYTVAFTGEDLSNIQGYQGTLQWSGMELLNIEYGAATSENFGLRFVNQGMITTSWNPSGNATGIEEVLFSLVLRANEDAQLSELLQVSSRYTTAEAYRDGTIMDFKLSFFASAQEQGKFVLYQNVPNPFTEGTIIGFDLPVAATATITIRDAKGALVQIVEGDYSAGYHTVQLTKQMINGGTGVFTYTVEAGDYRATKQMIVVD